MSERVLPTRSVIANVTWVAPRSAAAINRASGFNAIRAEGLPPVEAASAIGVTRPLSSSVSRCRPIVERDRPVAFAS